MRKQIVTLLTGAMLLMASSAMATQMTFGYLDNGVLVLTAGGLYGNELNPIPPDEAGFQLQGNVNGTLVDPVKIFIGVANVASTWTAPTISSILRNDQSSYTPTPNTATFAGYMDGTPGHTEAYGIVGLGNLNNSQNWANWSGAYAQLTGGSIANKFSIFQYNINGTNLTGGQKPVGIEFSSDLPDVTYLFGAAEFVTTNGNHTNYSWNGTAFTETGTNLPNVPVPEPGTMMLLGVGMFGLAIFGKRRMNKES